MASIYPKRGKWWIRYKKGGKWRDKSTGYRVGNIGETRQARLLARAQSDREASLDQSAGTRFIDWVPAWIEHRWGTLTTTTPDRYRRIWRRGLAPFLKEFGIDSPAQVQYSLAQAYIAWRRRHNGKRNTAIGELKLLSMIIDEAVRRGICQANPIARLRLSRDLQTHKTPWDDSSIRKVHEVLNVEHFGSFLHVSFLLGLFQARRLRECAPLLDDVNDQTIRYVVKGQKIFVHPIDVRIRPMLQKIKSHRRSLAHNTLCDIPDFPSIAWKKFLNSLGVFGLSHHGLRVTFITRAALAGVPMSLTMHFVGHGSAEVHRIYQQIKPEDLTGLSERVPFPSLSAAPGERTPPSTIPCNEPPSSAGQTQADTLPPANASP